MSRTREWSVMFTGREKAELSEVDVDDSPLAPDEIAGPTLVSLISPGTEINGQYLGENFPVRPGYVGAFRVEAVGSDVADVAPGDLVYATGPRGAGGHHSWQRCPRQAVLPIPAGLDPAVAVHARLMGVGMTTLTTTKARPPDRVLIFGLGPVGFLAAQVFRGCGYRVTAVEPLAERRAAAEKAGLDAREQAPEPAADDLDRYQLAIDCSGHEQAVLAACRAVRKRGEVVVIGVPAFKRSDVSAHELLHAVYRGYVTLRSGWEWEIPRHGEAFRQGSVFGNHAAGMQWLAEGRVSVEGLYALAAPADAQTVYQDLLHRRGPAASVLFDWSRV